MYGRCRLPDSFFPASNTYAGILQSFATFAFGFVARPIGGAVFGHYGDKLGRKTTLMVTLSLMAVGTVLIGLVPSYHQIGAWSGVLLVALRFVQGLGVGGEWGGSFWPWNGPNPTGEGLPPPGPKPLYQSACFSRTVPSL